MTISQITPPALAALAVPAVTISIVSHGQMALVLPLLQDLDAIHHTTPLHVVLTS